MKWQCPAKPPCANWQTVSCKHLQKSLPCPSRQSIRAAVTGRYSELIGSSNPELTPREQELEFRDKLLAHALPELHVNVLICRFVYNWGFGEIAEFLSIPDWQVFNVYKKALDLLKERKYGVKADCDES